MPALYEKYLEQGKFKSQPVKQSKSLYCFFAKKPQDPAKRLKFWGERNMGCIQELAIEICLDKVPPTMVTRQGRLASMRIREPG